jgi:hypothetical protein
LALVGDIVLLAFRGGFCPQRPQVLAVGLLASLVLLPLGDVFDVLFVKAASKFGAPRRRDHGADPVHEQDSNRPVLDLRAQERPFTVQREIDGPSARAACARARRSRS